MYNHTTAQQLASQLIQQQVGQPATLQGAELFGIDDDLLRLFSLLPGNAGQSAATKFTEFKNLIRTEAEAGALRAVPEIKVAVKQQVTPYVIAALALGLFGATAGFIALRRTRHQ